MYLDTQCVSGREYVRMARKAEMLSDRIFAITDRYQGGPTPTPVENLLVRMRKLMDRYMQYTQGPL